MKKILLITLLFLSSCALFKKTTKTTSEATTSSVTNMDAAELVLKSTERETQIFTFWNDSGIYQVQRIKEQIDQADRTHLKIERNDVQKMESSAKKSEPVKAWLFIGVGAIFIVLLFFFYKLGKV